jgi:hypothetical protein
MALEVDKKNLTILDVQFDNAKEFKATLYAISSNMIEGWEPTRDDVVRMKEYVISRRGATSREQENIFKNKKSR